MTTVAAAIISAVVTAGGAGWTLHNMYEDEPKIQEVRTEMVAMGEKSMNTILMQMMMQEQVRYEDELERLNAIDRSGHITPYQLNRRDTIQNRIRQIERQRELMLREAN